jgi:hypothetical protein
MWMVISIPGMPLPQVRIRKNQCAYCHKNGQWKNECPQLARVPRRCLRPEAEDELLRVDIRPPTGRLTPGKKTSLYWQS